MMGSSEALRRHRISRSSSDIIPIRPLFARPHVTRIEGKSVAADLTSHFRDAAREAAREGRTVFTPRLFDNHDLVRVRGDCRGDLMRARHRRSNRRVVRPRRPRGSDDPRPGAGPPSARTHPGRSLPQVRPGGASNVRRPGATACLSLG